MGSKAEKAMPISIDGSAGGKQSEKQLQIAGNPETFCTSGASSYYSVSVDLIDDPVSSPYSVPNRTLEPKSRPPVSPGDPASSVPPLDAEGFARAFRDANAHAAAMDSMQRYVNASWLSVGDSTLSIYKIKKFNDKHYNITYSFGDDAKREVELLNGHCFVRKRHEDEFSEFIKAANRHVRQKLLNLLKEAVEREPYTIKGYPIFKRALGTEIAIVRIPNARPRVRAEQDSDAGSDAGFSSDDDIFGFEP